MQELVTETNRIDFQVAVNDKLKEGWRVVPNTISVAIAIQKSSEGSYPQVEERYVAVLEKTA